MSPVDPFELTAEEEENIALTLQHNDECLDPLGCDWVHPGLEWTCRDVRARQRRLYDNLQDYISGRD